MVWSAQWSARGRESKLGLLAQTHTIDKQHQQCRWLTVDDPHLQGWGLETSFTDRSSTFRDVLLELKPRKAAATGFDGEWRQPLLRVTPTRSWYFVFFALWEMLRLPFQVRLLSLCSRRAESCLFGKTLPLFPPWRPHYPPSLRLPMSTYITICHWPLANSRQH